MSVTQPKYNPLGGLIRALLAARGLKAFELAEKVGISKQSISKIMTGLKRPRQTTFTKICEVLVSTPEEERALEQAYLNSKALKKIELRHSIQPWRQMHTFKDLLGTNKFKQKETPAPVNREGIRKKNPRFTK